MSSVKETDKKVLEVRKKKRMRPKNKYIYKMQN